MPKLTTSWDDNMVPYYHYTTLETLYKILASGKLRLTACNSLKNAAVETVALEVILSQFVKDKYPDEEGRELIRKYMEGRECSYMACFSKESPETYSFGNDILWKYYADNCKGVVIKFDFKKFPFNQHPSYGNDINGNVRRNTEFRMFNMMYDQAEFLKRMEMSGVDLYVFFTDSYKPKFCSFEQEVRLIVFLNKITDLKTLKHTINKNDIRLITAKEFNSDNRPSYLYFDIISAEGTESAIEKIFCKDKGTYSKLQRIFKDNEMCQLL